MSNALRTGRHLQASAYYRRFLDKRFRHFTLAGLVADDEPILLRQIYVPPVLVQEPVPDHADEEVLRKGGVGIAEWFERILAHHNAERSRGAHFTLTSLIAGEAGSGKTTLTSSIVASLASSVGDDFNRRFEGYLPFPILLRDAPIDHLHSLDELIAWWLDEAKRDEPGLIPDDVLAFLDAGRGIILLDGLDELGTIERRSGVLQWLRGHRWVQPVLTGMVTGMMGEPNLTVISARPSGFAGLLEQSGLLAHQLFLAPFSFHQIRTFLTRWFALRPMPPARRDEQVENLIARLQSEPRMSQLRMLARRPAYLASLAFVHGTRGALPHTRAALYDVLIDAYIDTLDRQRGLDRQRTQLGLRDWDRQEKREVLSAVAFQAHIGASAEGVNNKRRFAWSHEELVEAVARAIHQGKARFRTLRPEDATELTNYFVARTGLLVERQEGYFQFGHLSFQEYLTALFVLDRASGSTDKAAALDKLLLARLDTPGWREVALLALAVDATRTQGTGHRAVLAKLKPEQVGHMTFVDLVLSGKEVPLEDTERRAWVIAWLMHAAVQSALYYAMLIAFDANQDTIEDVHRAVCDAIVSNDDPLEAMRRLFGALDSSIAPAKCESWPMFDGESSAIEVPRKWVSDVVAQVDNMRLGANLLAILYCSERIPKDDAKKQLLDVARSVQLFTSRPELPAIALPTEFWCTLNIAYNFMREEALPMRTPLSWVCADDSEQWLATLAIRRGKHDENAMCRWRRLAWLCLVEVKRLMYLAHVHAALLPEHNEHAQSDLIGCIKAQNEVAKHIFAWMETAEIAGYRGPLVVARRKYGFWMKQEVSSWLDISWKDILWKDTSWKNTSWKLGPGILGEMGSLRKEFMHLPRLRQLQQRFVKSGDNFTAPYVDRCLALIIAGAAIPAANKVLGESGEPITRSIVEAWRTNYCHPSYMSRDLANGINRELASAEWLEVLHSPLSPLPMLDAILAVDWEQFDVSAASIKEKLEQAAERLLAEVDIAASGENPPKV